MAKIAKFGDHAERKAFSKIKNTLELTDLLEIQKKSYQRFLEEGIKEVFEELFPVESFTGNISLELGDYYLETTLEDFVNVYNHEKNHLEMHICDEFNIDPHSEEAAELSGNLAKYLYNSVVE